MSKLVTATMAGRLRRNVRGCAGRDCDTALHFAVQSHRTAIWDYTAAASLLAEADGWFGRTDGTNVLEQRLFDRNDDCDTPTSGGGKDDLTSHLGCAHDSRPIGSPGGTRP